MLVAILAYVAGRSSGRAQGRRETLVSRREPTARDIALLRACGVVVAVCSVSVLLAA